MDGNLGGVNMSTGVSGAALVESSKGVNGGMAARLESKTLVENPGDKIILSDGVGVTEECKVLVGESSNESVTCRVDKEVAEAGRSRISNIHNLSRNRVVETSSQDDEWRSTRSVICIVERLLQGKFGLHDEEDVNIFENEGEGNLIAGGKRWQGYTGESTSVSGIMTNGTEVGRDLHMVNSACQDVAVIDSCCQDVAVIDPGCQDMAVIELGCQDVAVIGSGCQDMAVIDSGCQDMAVIDSGCQDVTAMDLGCQDVTVMDSGRQDVAVIDLGCQAIAAMDSGCQAVAAMDSGCQDVAAMDSGCQDVAALDSGCQDIAFMDLGCQDVAIMDSDCQDVAIMDSGCLEAAILDSGCRDVAILDSGCRDVAILGYGCRDVAIMDSGCRDVAIMDSGCRDVAIMDSGCRDVAVSLSGDRNSGSNEILLDGKLEDIGVNDVNGPLTPKTRGQCDTIEKEGEYYLSDLVWGKVRGHPWWPGQIFPPSAASGRARKYFKRDSYLIAYFGDQSFAWNEGSKIKPFRMCFSEMEKQSTGERYCHAVDCALDEFARRIELGLSCSCVPPGLHFKLKGKRVINAGVRKESSHVTGGDNLFSAALFLPGELVRSIGSLAEIPHSKVARLQFKTILAQLLAFNRWRGNSQLPVLQACGRLFEDDSQFKIKGQGSPQATENKFLNNLGSGAADSIQSRKRKLASLGDSSQKLRHLSVSGGEVVPKIRENDLFAIMSSNGLGIRSDESKNASMSGRKTSSRKSRLVKLVPAGIPGPDVILSNLILAANSPTWGLSIIRTPLYSFLRQFRNSNCPGKPSSGKKKGKQQVNMETTTTVQVPVEDSYWADRIIQNYSQDQVVFELKTLQEGAALLRANGGVVLDLDHNKELDESIWDMVSSEIPSFMLDGVSGEYSPTALILNFTNSESIPSIVNLNEIFSRYGPLDEVGTKIISQRKIAKVVFKRRTDAEVAYTSNEKYSSVGPSLISCSLNSDPDTS